MLTTIMMLKYGQIEYTYSILVNVALMLADTDSLSGI
jgi:hypothetical protein